MSYVTPIRFTVVIEHGPISYGAYVPNLPEPLSLSLRSLDDTRVSTRIDASALVG